MLALSLVAIATPHSLSCSRKTWYTVYSETVNSEIGDLWYHFFFFLGSYCDFQIIVLLWFSCDDILYSIRILSHLLSWLKVWCQRVKLPVKKPTDWSVFIYSFTSDFKCVTCESAYTPWVYQLHVINYDNLQLYNYWTSTNVANEKVKPWYRIWYH